MRDKTTVRIGINFAEVLGVVFIALRLCGVIDWLFENPDYDPKPKVIPEIPCFSRCNILIGNDKEMNIEPMHGNNLFL